MQIKIAFIGAGFMAEAHIKAFADISGVFLAGIYSRTFARAEKLALKFSIEEVYTSIDELYMGTQADLVIIAVPELSVNQVCKEAFKFPWVCLVEKPVGYNLTDAQEIAQEAHRHRAKVYVALNRRHYSSTRCVIDDIESVDENRLVHIMDQEDPRSALKAGAPLLVVQNWMYANSIHVIDYFKIFCRGEIVDLHHVIKWNPQDPRFVMVKLRYSSGDVGVYQAIWNGPGPWAVSINTQAKRWEMRPLEDATVQVYGSRKPELLPKHSWDDEFKPGLRFQAEEAIKAVRGEQHRLPSLADAMDTMKLIHLIYEM